MRIKSFKEKYNGERCFILGNGPSLDETPLNHLNNEYTFATNEIHKIYPQTTWRPSFYLSFRRSPKIESIQENVQLEIPCFFAKEYKHNFERRDNVYFLNQKRYNDNKYDCLNDPEIPRYAFSYWSDKPEKHIYWYNTSLYPAYQLASFMGFDEVYLLGCDLGQDTTAHILFENGPDPHFDNKIRSDNYDSKVRNYVAFLNESGQPLVALLNGLYYKTRMFFSRFSKAANPGRDPHFGDNYYERPKLKRGLDDKQRRAHKLAKIKLEERGVGIYNATIGGKLEIFPRVDLTKIV